MPRGIRWDYSVHCFSSGSPGCSQYWTTRVAREKSGRFWIGLFGEGSGSYSCNTAGDFIDDLPEDSLEEFYSYFESDPKYRDVAQMIRWRRKDISVIDGRRCS